MLLVLQNKRNGCEWMYDFRRCTTKFSIAFQLNWFHSKFIWRKQKSPNCQIYLLFSMQKRDIILFSSTEHNLDCEYCWSGNDRTLPAWISKLQAEECLDWSYLQFHLSAHLVARESRECNRKIWPLLKTPNSHRYSLERCKLFRVRTFLLR